MSEGSRKRRVEALERYGRDLERAAREHERGGAGRRLAARVRPARVRPAIVVALLVPVLVAAGFTPTGRSMADRLGELVGIGDEPTSGSSIPIDFPDVVIDVGESPNGTPFEIVAASDRNLSREAPEDTCIRLELLASDGPVNTGGSCHTADAARLLSRQAMMPVATLGPDELGPERLLVYGLARTDIDRAEVLHSAPDGTETAFPIRVARLDAELAGQIEAGKELTFLVGFLPGDLVPSAEAASSSTSRDDEVARPARSPRALQLGPSPAAEAALRRLSVVAYDVAGSEVARTRLDWYSHAAPILYRDLVPSSGEQALPEAYEECLLEIAEATGEDGRVKPDLPESVLQEIDACARERMDR